MSHDNSKMVLEIQRRVNGIERAVGILQEALLRVSLEVDKIKTHTSYTEPEVFKNLKSRPLIGESAGGSGAGSAAAPAPRRRTAASLMN